MKGKAVTIVAGFQIEMTAEEACGLYASLYHLSGHLGVTSPETRKKYLWADQLFELYDLLNEGGFS